MKQELEQKAFEQRKTSFFLFLLFFVGNTQQYFAIFRLIFLFVGKLTEGYLPD